MLTSQVMNLIGDVKGKVAVMMDDMIDTAGESSAFNAKNLAARCILKKLKMKIKIKIEIKIVLRISLMVS